MKRKSMHPVPVLLILMLMIASLPATAAGQAGPPDPNSLQKGQGESYDIAIYRVDNIVSREDRTAVAQTGAAIDEIGADYVIVDATPEEARAIGALGYPIQRVISRPRSLPSTFRPPTRPITTMRK